MRESADAILKKNEMATAAEAAAAAPPRLSRSNATRQSQLKQGTHVRFGREEHRRESDGKPSFGADARRRHCCSVAEEAGQPAHCRGGPHRGDGKRGDPSDVVAPVGLKRQHIRRACRASPGAPCQRPSFRRRPPRGWHRRRLRTPAGRCRRRPPPGRPSSCPSIPCPLPPPLCTANNDAVARREAIA